MPPLHGPPHPCGAISRPCEPSAQGRDERPAQEVRGRRASRDDETALPRTPSGMAALPAPHMACGASGETRDGIPEEKSFAAFAATLRVRAQRWSRPLTGDGTRSMVGPSSGDEGLTGMPLKDLPGGPVERACGRTLDRAAAGDPDSGTRGTRG